MTWIKTYDPANAPEQVREASMRYKKMYPGEYRLPSQPQIPPEGQIGSSHTLLPDVMYHAFATFGAAMDPSLPLSRKDHEMIATVVSVTNHCRY